MESDIKGHICECGLRVYSGLHRFCTQMVWVTYVDVKNVWMVVLASSLNGEPLVWLPSLYMELAQKVKCSRRVVLEDTVPSRRLL